MKKIQLIGTLLFWILYAPMSYVIWYLQKMNALDVIIIFLIGVLFNLLFLVFSSLMIKQRRHKLAQEWAREIAKDLEEELRNTPSSPPVALPLPPTQENIEPEAKEELIEESDLV